MGNVLLDREGGGRDGEKEGGRIGREGREEGGKRREGRRARGGGLMQHYPYITSMTN